MLELVQALGELAEPHGAWVRLHYVYPYPHVDEVIPLMAHGQGAAVPGRAVPAQPPRRAAPHEAAGQRREEPGAHPALARDVPGARGAQHLHRRVSRARRKRSSSTCWTSCAKRRSTAPAALPTARSKAPRPTTSRACCRRRCARSAARASWRWPSRCRRNGCSGASARRCRCWWIRRRRSAARAASAARYADAPEIDGTVRLLPPEKISKQLKVGRIHPCAHRGDRGPRPRGRAGLTRLPRPAATRCKAALHSVQRPCFGSQRTKPAHLDAAGFIICIGAQERTRTSTMLLAST